MSAGRRGPCDLLPRPERHAQVAPALAGEQRACVGDVLLVRLDDDVAEYRCPTSVLLGRHYREVFAPWPVMTPDPASRSSGSSTRRRPAPCTDDGLSHGQDPAHRRRPDAVRPDGGVSRAARFRPGAGQSRRSGRPGVSSALRRDRGAGRVAARPGWAESLPRSARPLGRADPDALRYPQRPGASPGPGRGRRRLCGEARVATCAAGADTRAVAPAQSVAAGAASAGIRRTGHRLRATPGLAARRRGGP